jgi:transcriptional regulator with XRE-family HTH domain
MSAPTNDVDRQTRPRTLAEKLTALRATRKLRPATDREHAADIRDADGDTSIQRQPKPLTYKEIAEKLGGITPTFVGYLLTGERDNPTLKVLQAWAELYEVPVGYLADNDAILDAKVEEDLARDRVRTDRSMHTIADRLNGLIKAIRPGGGGGEYTDTQLADMADCSLDEIRELRNGHNTTISLRSVQRLADGFGVTVGYLVDGIDAERIEQRVDLLREFGDVGAVKMALDILQVKEPDHQRTLAEMANAFIRVEAQGASTSAPIE